jgi:hypothetical protein
MKKKLVLIILLGILLSPITQGQELKNGFETKIGYGYLQGYNVGLNYFYKKNLKVGLGVGTHDFSFSSIDNDNTLSLQLENTLYFGQPNKQNLGGLYFNQQLTFLDYGNTTHINASSSDRLIIPFIGINLGGSISFSKKIALELELGPVFYFNVDFESDRIFTMYPLTFNGRAQLTYKL